MQVFQNVRRRRGRILYIPAVMNEATAFSVRLVTLIIALAIGTASSARPVIPQVAESAGSELGLKSVWCPDCKLHISEIAVLGDAEGPGILKGHVVEARRDSRGRYYLLEHISQSIPVFGPEGRHLTTIGREGQGPGEFRNVSDIVIGEGDTLYAFDQMNGTLSVFDPDYAFTRSARLQIRPTMFIEPVSRGRFIISSWVRTPERIGFPLHLVDPEGRVEASFGSERGEFRPGQVSPVNLAVADSGQVWAGHSHRYSVKLWHAFEGRKLRELRREVDWFPPGSPAEPLTADRPPPPRLTALGDDGRSRLWTKVSVADPQWREAVEMAGDGAHVEVTDPVQYNDTVIEVLDSTTGEALARFKFDRGFFFVDLREGLVGRNLLDEALVPRFKIYRLKLVPQGEDNADGR